MNALALKALRNSKRNPTQHSKQTFLSKILSIHGKIVNMLSLKSSLAFESL